MKPYEYYKALNKDIVERIDIWKSEVEELQTQPSFSVRAIAPELRLEAVRLLQIVGDDLGACDFDIVTLESQQTALSSRAHRESKPRSIERDEFKAQFADIDIEKQSMELKRKMIKYVYDDLIRWDFVLTRIVQDIRIIGEE